VKPDVAVLMERVPKPKLEIKDGKFYYALKSLSYRDGDMVYTAFANGSCSIINLKYFYVGDK